MSTAQEFEEKQTPYVVEVPVNTYATAHGPVHMVSALYAQLASSVAVVFKYHKKNNLHSVVFVHLDCRADIEKALNPFKQRNVLSMRAYVCGLIGQAPLIDTWLALQKFGVPYQNITLAPRENSWGFSLLKRAPLSEAFIKGMDQLKPSDALARAQQDQCECLFGVLPSYGCIRPIKQALPRAFDLEDKDFLKSYSLG